MDVSQCWVNFGPLSTTLANINPVLGKHLFLIKLSDKEKLAIMVILTNFFLYFLAGRQRKRGNSATESHNGG